MRKDQASLHARGDRVRYAAGALTWADLAAGGAPLLRASAGGVAVAGGNVVNVVAPEWGRLRARPDGLGTPRKIGRRCPHSPGTGRASRESAARAAGGEIHGAQLSRHLGATNGQADVAQAVSFVLMSAIAAST